MDKKGKFSIALSILSVAVIGFTSAQLVTASNNLASLQQEKRVADDRADQAKHNYVEKRRKVTNEAMYQALHSSDPSLNTVAKQNSDYAKVLNASKQFFKTYYTFNDQSDYQKRANKLSNLITSNVKNNKEIFDDGKDDTGNDLITGAGLQSKFEKAEAYLTQSDDSTVNALVKVTNQSWTKDNPDQKGTSVNYYELVYNVKTNKISGLKLVLTVNNANAEDSEDATN